MIKQYQKELKEILGKYVEELKTIKEDCDSWKVEKHRQHSEYSRERIENAIVDKTHEYNMRSGDMMVAIKRLYKKYMELEEQADILDPAEINDDVKLLNCGVTLSEDDLRLMIGRNEGNRTMQLLAVKYAKEHDMHTVFDTSDIGTRSKAYDNLNGTANIITNRAQNMNDIETAENTYKYAFGGVDDAE